MKTAQNLTSSHHWENYMLTNDSGCALTFVGRVFSESSYHDEETGTITKLRLFITEDKKQVYSILTGTGAKKTHRFYVIKPSKETCEVFDGFTTITLPTAMFFSVAFGLCGIDPVAMDESHSSISTPSAAIAG